LTSSTAIAVAQTDPKQPMDTYLELVKGSPLTLVVHHTSKTAVAIVASDVTQNLTQTLFQMAEATDSSEPATKTDDGKTIITVPTITTDQTLGEWKADAADSTSSLTDSQKFADSKSLKAPLILSGTQPDPSSTTSDTNQSTSTSSATPKVEGTSVTLSPNQATNAPLAKPALAKAGLAKFTTLASTTSPIVVSAANIQVLTGTSQFDTGTASTSTGNLGADPKGDPDSSTSYTPGYDSNASNDLVRSFDTITYLVSFNVQNNTNTNYSDIGYQVTATLPNAVTLQSDGKTPQVNGSIVNGTMYTNADGTQYSQGIMSSSISTTGQVVIPVVVQVSSAPNGLKITPTFTIKLTTASNNDTLNDDSLNQTYDSSTFSGLGVKPTVVSAAPSVTVQLVKGDAKQGTAASQVLNGDQSSNTMLDAWDVGAVEKLAPLTGRTSSDYRGTTYPTGPITYTLGMSGTYTPSSGTATAMTNDSTSAYEFSVQGIAPAVLGRTSTWSTITGGYQAGVSASAITSNYTNALAVPNANTGKIYTTQPTSGQSAIGVYASGSFTGTNSTANGLASTATITNSGYTGISNPYTYLMTGYTGDAKQFASSEMIVRWDESRTYNLGVANSWTSYAMSLSVQSISYNGKTIANPNGSANNLVYTTNIKPPGNFTAATIIYNNAMSQSGITFANINGGSPITVSDGPASQWNSSQSNPSAMSQNFGDDWLYPGQKAVLAVYVVDTSKITSGGFRTDTILSWDPSAFIYDPNAKSQFIAGNQYSSFNAVGLQFGVAKNFSQTAPVTLVDLPYTSTLAQYTWYPDWASVVAAGVQNQVSAAIVSRQNVLSSWNNNVNAENIGIPVIVKQQSPGSTTPNGNHLVLMASVQETNLVTGATFDPIVNSPTSNIVNNTTNAANVGQYIPTTFNSNGTVNNKNGTIGGSTVSQVYWNVLGDSAFVKPYAVTTTTTVDKPVYNATDAINLKIDGNFKGSSTQSYGGSLATTLPVGVTYQSGSATDGTGKALPDPTITTTGSGATLQQILTWNFANVSLTNYTEVNFKALPSVAALTFDPTSLLTGTLSATTVGSMWLASSTAGTDTTGATSNTRSSQANFQVKLGSVSLTLDKEVDKTAIEDGNKATVANDPASDVPDTSITYSLTVSNATAAAMSNVNVLDVLPYNGDSRGTSLSGGYTVTNVASSDSTVKYSTNTTAPSSSTYNESSDPATITTGSGGWSALAAVGTAPTATKAILFNIPTLNKGTTIVLTITIQPDNK
ncbi:beta strand repeat-containing protein, partial [Lactococcus hircilactis]|uniref:beta strand repeat-containing protein n=3 Tax=Lactococcus hircilactis TaxID=1494462 RepID=UPI0014783B38